MGPVRLENDTSKCVMWNQFVCVDDCAFFFAEKDGTKAVNLTYKEKLQFVAYTKQVAHGKYRPDVSPDVGFLDVVGNDRRCVSRSGNRVPGPQKKS